MHAYRTHTCADLTAANVGDTVRLSGWVHRVRDHGGVLFIDLRDHYGVTQVLADPDSPVFAELEKVRSEWCIQIEGTVKARDTELVNPKIPTGEIEIFIRDMSVLGAAAELPLQVFDEPDFPEETRLKYRFLDLRRETLHNNMILRSKVVSSIRKRMEGIGFNEFQTPIITASSPEGARDFLVPSRLHPGKFYALPQAPQQFKQLIMVAGFDKYFQIAPCFRDEDPRADRSPTDFYQLDVEMSFVEQQDVFDTVEPVLRGVFEEFGGERPVSQEWPQISYRDAALWYGTDKPDLRNPIKMQVVSEHFRGSGFKIFANLLETEGTLQLEFRAGATFDAHDHGEHDEHEDHDDHDHDHAAHHEEHAEHEGYDHDEHHDEEHHDDHGEHDDHHDHEDHDEHGEDHAETDHDDHDHDNHADDDHEDHDHEDHAEAEDEFSDHVTRVDGVEILHAWAQATESSVARVFMEITNEGETDLTLVGGDTEIGGPVTVMAMDYSDGAKAVDIGSFPLKAGAEIDLTPDGLFLEIADLDMHLDEGASFEMHVELDPMGEIEVVVEVEAEDARTHSHAGHNH